jgi:hypothetical protein
VSIRDESLTLSGKTASELKLASKEAELIYELWYEETTDGCEEIPTDVFSDFQMMLKDVETPLPSKGEWSDLDGLTVCQVLLAMAYDRAGTAVASIDKETAGVERCGLVSDSAARLTIDAARFLDEAKRYIALGKKDLFQNAGTEDCELVA